MINQPEAKTWYEERIAILTADLQKTNRERRMIAWQRLGIVLAGFLFVYNTWNTLNIYVLICLIFALILLFLYRVSSDVEAKRKAQKLSLLIEINQKELRFLQFDFSDSETGDVFKPANHAYAEDLDIFGKSSLYQYINRCTSEQGKEYLSNRLLNPLPFENILPEQKASAELTTKSVFRQELQAAGQEASLKIKTEKTISNWFSQPLPYSGEKWSVVANIFPVISLLSIALYAYDIINSGIFSLLVFGFMTFAFSLSKKIGKVYDDLSDLANETESFSKQLFLIEKETFQSEKLSRLQQELKTSGTSSAFLEIASLHKLLNRCNMRLNTLAFFFLNTFLLWDLRQMLSLHEWQNRNKNHVSKWFDAIAEMEYSCSLATLAFNRTDGWCFPIISEEEFNIRGSEIGHPLIASQKRIDNSFHLSGNGKVAIITGSNMGGKSTFLRSLGVNIVLALMGSKVCATEFSASYTRLMSSMRVADNLAESTSTFYAELKKLKSIIESVNRGDNIFILLDEILRGTNSLDRHAGSVALLKQFIQRKAVAVIATHDVELARLEESYADEIQNYHFDVQAKGNELYFDYKLKPGICQSMNASILMKNIGIEVS